MKFRELLTKRFVKRISLFIVTLLCVQLFIIIGMVSYFHRIMNQQMIGASGNVLNAINNHINQSVEQAETDLRSLLSLYNSIRILSSDNENARIIVSSQLSETMQTFTNRASNTDAYIIYNKKHNIFLASRSERLTYPELLVLREFAETLDYTTSDFFDWTVMYLEGTPYLLHCYYYYESYFVALFNVNSLLTTSSYNRMQSETQNIAISNAEGAILSFIGTAALSETTILSSDISDVFFINTQDVHYGDLKISYISEDNPYTIRDSLLLSILGVCMISFLVLFVFILYLRREIFQPISRLMEMARLVANGDYTRRASLACHSPEFQELAASLNSMLDMIIRQRISSYESIISRKNLELKYLQMQIRPHFFLNTLSTINSMLYTNDNAQIRNFISLFSQNVRYIFTASFQTVPLVTELEHIRDYIKCQSILYPDCVYSFIEADLDANGWMVPQMLLHTLVENVYKHTVSHDRFVSLFIRASIEHIDEEDVLQIIVEDDGVGFPGNIIEEVNQSLGAVPQASVRIGLMNLAHTLYLMFGRNSLIHIENKPYGGGIVTVIIPPKTLDFSDHPTSALEVDDI